MSRPWRLRHKTDSKSGACAEKLVGSGGHDEAVSRLCPVAEDVVKTDIEPVSIHGEANVCMSPVQQESCNIAGSLAVQNCGRELHQCFVAFPQLIFAVVPGIDSKRCKPHGTVFADRIERVGLPVRSPTCFGYEQRI